MKKLFVIFDFDGTIADTHGHFIKISNQLADEFHYRKIQKEEIASLKHKTSFEIVKHLNIPLLKIPAIISRAKKELNQSIGQIQPAAGLSSALAEIRKLPITLGILSSNSHENIKKFLTGNNIDLFNIIQSTPSIWGKHLALKKIITANGFKLAEVIYIGDETRDIEAARKAGVKVAAVAWGYNSPETLKKLKPDYFLNQPSELLTLCRGLN